MNNLVGVIWFWDGGVYFRIVLWCFEKKTVEGFGYGYQILVRNSSNDKKRKMTNHKKVKAA